MSIMFKNKDKYAASRPGGTLWRFQGGRYITETASGLTGQVEVCDLASALSAGLGP